jgi:transcriptional regulator with XRE-family HTH domain
MTRVFGQKLRQLREARHWTQVELASRLKGVTQSYVSHLEGGNKEPSVEVALQIADLLGVTVDYLLRDTIPISLDPKHENWNR